MLIDYDSDKCVTSRLQQWQRAARAAAFGPKWDLLMNPYSESLGMLT